VDNVIKMLCKEIDTHNSRFFYHGVRTLSYEEFRRAVETLRFLMNKGPHPQRSMIGG
jgi:hypothetical protein